MKKIYFLLGMVLVVNVSLGQQPIASLGVAVTQNFDGLTTATFNLTDNTSITGVYALRAAGNAIPNVFTADIGTSTTGQFKNYGSSSASDRALGSLS